MAGLAPFTGVGVALVTLFDEEGEIDAPATADHAARLVDAGVDAVVVAGTTGEAAALDDEERSDLLIAVRSAVDGRVPVLAGTGAPSARQAVVLSRRAAGDGADALLVLSPAGVARSAAVLRAGRVRRSTCPVLAYHYPKASAPGVPVDVLRQLPWPGSRTAAATPSGSSSRPTRSPSGAVHRRRHAHPPGRRHRLLRRHPRPRQRRPRGLPPRVEGRRHRPARAHQRPPQQRPRRHRRPQARPLRPPRHPPVTRVG